NSMRGDFADRYRAIVDRYNSGGSSTENYYEDLVDFMDSLDEEEQRHTREGLTEVELELFDILLKDKIANGDKIKVKNAARKLLPALLKARPRVLVQDWYKGTQSKLRVKEAIRHVLDQELPPSYTREIFDLKGDNVLEWFYRKKPEAA
ncbi:MAG: DUF3387 domain-containing protein, partial [bacterium]|nr:DUF3387 domain-containing protein [bacterium]